MNACDITFKSQFKSAFQKTRNYYNNNKTIIDVTPKGTTIFRYALISEVAQSRRCMVTWLESLMKLNRALIKFFFI